MRPVQVTHEDARVNEADEEKTEEPHEEVGDTVAEQIQIRVENFKKIQSQVAVLRIATDNFF